MKIGDLVEGLASAAATRNYVSALTGAAGVFVMLGAIDQQTATDAIAGAQQFMDGVGQMIGGAKKVWIAIFPVAVVVISKFAGSAASLTGRLQSITTDPKVQIQGKIVVDDVKVAEAVPSPQVVPAK